MKFNTEFNGYGLDSVSAYVCNDCYYVYYEQNYFGLKFKFYTTDNIRSRYLDGT